MSGSASAIQLPTNARLPSQCVRVNVPEREKSGVHRFPTVTDTQWNTSSSFAPDRRGKNLETATARDSRVANTRPAEFSLLSPGQ